MHTKLSKVELPCCLSQVCICLNGLKTGKCEVRRRGRCNKTDKNNTKNRTAKSELMHRDFVNSGDIIENCTKIS